MQMFGSRNDRGSKKLDKVFVFIDESGTPYFVDPKDRSWKRNGITGNDPFVLGGLMTSDPEELGRISLEQPRHTKRPKYQRQPPGKGELKHSDSNNAVIKSVIRGVDSSDAVPFMVVVEKLDPKTHDVLDKNELYSRSFSDLAELIAEYGKEGEYRFRVDHSDYYDQDLFEKIVVDAFGPNEIFVLPEDFMDEVDSKDSPQVQTTDIVVGERKEREERGSGDLFDSRHGILTRRRNNRRE